MAESKNAYSKSLKEALAKQKMQPEYLKTAKEIRDGFGSGDAERDAGLKRPETVAWENDLSYGLHGEANLMDIYYPAGTEGVLPTIVSIHGGAWCYGSKEVYQFYCCSLAERGFTVVNFNYRLAPEHPFPAAIEDVNQVFCWMKEQGAAHHIDTKNLFAVGDSAGAQLLAQYMAILTNPSFAEIFGFSLPELSVRAVALNCGKYNMEDSDIDLEPAFHAYFNGEPHEFVFAVDTISYLNRHFPPAFVMTACHDFLCGEAEPMAKALQAAGVEAELHIYGSDDRPDIAHVFHCNMRLPEAANCNDDECAFFRKHLGK